MLCHELGGSTADTGLLALDEEERGNIFLGILVDVGAGSHLAFASDLKEISVVMLNGLDSVYGIMIRESLNERGLTFLNPK